MSYNVEKYWSNVAQQLADRKDGVQIAGDDDPFYTYKRNKFIELFRKQAFQNKEVLEVGSGPGGNIEILLSMSPKKASGADISEEMIKISKSNPSNKNVDFVKIDGRNLPFEDNTFDIIYTVTVLQHIVADEMLHPLIASICRVSRSDVMIFERIEKQRKVSDTNVGRTVEEYQSLFQKQGFDLYKTEQLRINISYFICGAIRRLFNKSDRQEGEPQTKLAIWTQKILLPITKILDPLFPMGRDLTLLHFKKIGS